ncbi:F-box/kelch-repeat protein At3g23880-like [Nicotiana tabacum]|uniref:F-box/kelch-repeat protein At3g23880-like n=1 Tax=Nicotiana tabacum TaxID=4097 RepID=A0A1S3YKS2_TOBAC|nr:PREDICTED: F-box/kelch-repeat protein At3g23880-like [Nicotiana tabacum]
MGTHIPEEEIVMDILTRLPVKSLFRFKCVSESWKTIISQPYFKKKHLDHAKNQLNSQKLLFAGSRRDRTIYFYCYSLSSVQLVKDRRSLDWPLNSEIPYCRMKVFASCDGLFLIGIWSKPDDQPSLLLLWNPTTRESIIIPHETPQLESVYGLGYDSTSDDYILFRVDTDEQALDEILALKNGSWRKIYKTSSWEVSYLLSGWHCLAFVHEAFHWLGFLRGFSVASFNISDEKYREIPLPVTMPLIPQIGPEAFYVDVGVSVVEGMLSVFYNDEITFNLWVMKNYGVIESWTKLLNIPSNGIHFIRPIYKFFDGEMLLRYRDWIASPVYTTSDGPIGLSNRIWPQACDIGEIRIYEDGVIYTESLISPKLDH